MDKETIYESLNPDWWTPLGSTGRTQFYSTKILFSNGVLNNLTYISSGAYTTGGLNSGITAPSTQFDNFINSLRLEAAQRLFDMHCTAIIDHGELTSVFGATE